MGELPQVGMALSIQDKLKYCIATNFALLAFLIVICWKFSDLRSGKDNYMKAGPSADLKLLGISIDTWEKYAALQVLMCIFQIADTVIQEFANPILGFNIYNPDKKEITDFTRFQLQFYAQSFWFVNNVKYALMLLISVTQIDLAISKVLYSELAGIYTIRVLISEKKFVSPPDLESQAMDSDQDDPEAPLVV